MAIAGHRAELSDVALESLDASQVEAWERFVALLGEDEGRQMIGTAEAVEGLMARSWLQRAVEADRQVPADRLQASDEAYRRLAPALLDSTRVELYAADNPVTDWWWQVRQLAGSAAEETLVDVPTAASIKRVHPHTVRAAIHAGELPSRRLGRGFLIHRRDLDRWTARSVGRPRRQATADELLDAFNLANTAQDWGKAHVLAEVLAKQPSSARRCLAVAIDAYNRGRHQDAVSWIERARSGALDDVAQTTAAITIGLSLVQLKRAPEAVQELKELVPAPSLGWRAKHALAEALLAAGQPGDAALVIQAAIEEKPDASELRYQAARISFHAGDSAEALTNIVLFRAIEPDDPTGLMMHGSILGQLGDATRDSVLYRRAAELFRSALPAEGFRAQAKLGIAAARLGDWREALAEAKSLWESGHTRPANSVVEAAIASVTLKGDGAEITEAAEMAERWTKSTPWTRAHRALAYVMEGRSEEALEAAETEIARLDRLPTPLQIILSAVLIAAGRVEDAESALVRVSRLPQWFRSASLLRLRAALVSGDRDSADQIVRVIAAEEDGEVGALAQMCDEMFTAREEEHERQRLGAYLSVAALASADERAARAEYDPKSWDIGHRVVSKPLERSVNTLPS